MSDEKFATWFSRIIRWALAAGFAWAAYQYDDLKIFYLFALVAFITGFMVPRRCIDHGCNTEK
jgi:hypothetical protein